MAEKDSRQAQPGEERIGPAPLQALGVSESPSNRVMNAPLQDRHLGFPPTSPPPVDETDDDGWTQSAEVLALDEAGAWHFAYHWTSPEGSRGWSAAGGTDKIVARRWWPLDTALAAIRAPQQVAGAAEATS